MRGKESIDHLKRKHYWFEELTNQGYVCKFEQSFNHKINYNDRLIVDLVAENNSEIVIVEVIKSSWSGKQPDDYIISDKPIRFIKDEYLTNGKKVIPKKQNNKKLKDLNLLFEIEEILNKLLKMNSDTLLISVVMKSIFSRLEDIKEQSDIYPFTNTLYYKVDELPELEFKELY